MLRVFIVLALIVVPVFVPYLLGRVLGLLNISFPENNPRSYGDYWLNGLMSILIGLLIFCVFGALWALSGKII